MSSKATKKRVSKKKEHNISPSPPESEASEAETNTGEESENKNPYSSIDEECNKKSSCMFSNFNKQYITVNNIVLESFDLQQILKKSTKQVYLLLRF